MWKMTTFSSEKTCRESQCKMHSFNRLNFQNALRIRQSRDGINTVLLNYTVFHIQTDRRRESVRSWGGNKNERSEKRVARSDGWWRRLRSRQTPRTLATFDRQFLSSFRMRRARSSSLLPPLSFPLPPFLSLFLSFVPLSSFLFFFFSSVLSRLLLAQSPTSSEVRRRHFAPRRRHSCFCRGAYK